jgi:regulator of sigma E protease
MRNGYKPVSVTVKRGSEKIVFEDVQFPQVTSQGVVFGAPDFSVLPEEKTFFTVVKNSFYTCKSTVKMIWESLFDLISGRYGVEQVSGPIGVTGAITDAAKTGPYSLFYMIAVIAMNLGVFNLLPIPALDGGSLLLLLVEMVTKKKLPPRIEGAIKGAGFAVLMLIALLVSAKDIIYLFK